MMSRIARRIHRDSFGSTSHFDPEQHYLETALRGRTARKVRTHLRRMEPVVVRTPRWSAPTQFLEDLALDLAVGEPAIGCRTVGFRPLKGRTIGEAWQFTLHVLTQLGRRGWRAPTPTTVADRRGFRWALSELLEEAHRASPHRVALLAHGAEHLPVELIEDLTDSWTSYFERHPEGARCTLLLAGSLQAGWLSMGSGAHIDLADYGEAEAAAAIVGRAGPLPIFQLEQVARFTGGVPGLVDQVGRQAREIGHLPRRQEDLLGCLGSVGDEMRGAVQIVAAHDGLSGRLLELAPGEALHVVPELDDPLVMSGLARIDRGSSEPRVVLRAPAIAELIG